MITKIKEQVPVKIWTQFNHALGLPSYETIGSSGLDIRSNQDVIISPNETELIPTGIYVDLPAGYELQVRPRSGMSLKTSLQVANSPGTIDSDYTGEIKIIAYNKSNRLPLEIRTGDRIAQLVLKEVPRLIWIEVDSKDELTTTIRGDGGFGHTGSN